MTMTQFKHIPTSPAGALARFMHQGWPFVMLMPRYQGNKRLRQGATATEEDTCRVISWPHWVLGLQLMEYQQATVSPWNETVNWTDGPEAFFAVYLWRYCRLYNIAAKGPLKDRVDLEQMNHRTPEHCSSPGPQVPKTRICSSLPLCGDWTVLMKNTISTV